MLILFDIDGTLVDAGGAGLTARAPALRQLPKLERLYLYGNQITAAGAQEISTVLQPRERAGAAMPDRQWRASVRNGRHPGWR